MITIIDYGLGNLASVANALDKLDVKYIISDDPDVLKRSTALILPGVGAAGQGMKNLKKRKLDKAIIKEVKKGKPILGICLGMQLLFEKSEEDNVLCLGILKGSVNKFRIKRKIPQIGWNNVSTQSQNLVTNKTFDKIPNNSYFYFVNSFYCSPTDSSDIIGKTEYGENFASVVAKDKVLGVQFHPEKSGKAGFKILRNFIKYYVN